MPQENEKVIEVIKVSLNLTHADKANVETIFAYQMRDQIAVRGAVAVQKEFDTWFQSYVSDKLTAESKAIRERIEQKKWNMVLELQKKFGYSYADATKQVFGVPLVNQPATQQTERKTA